ncbi:protein SUPPRESSOR OF K(+) TRANSPORT GROWTH DEFECT 1-like [Castanea sativa]|uniref:protein SUPPRESSOR OF K(+) TRANSPORT GROWTH DEFECT 1-like n=1 Tax=Castanea sativa TaxID=21020 RepID=UPI003F64E552
MTTVTTGELLELAEKNVKLAVVEDKAGQFEEAYKLYMKAFEYAGIYLFYEDNPWLKKKNRQSFLGHYRRATKIRGRHHLHGPSLSDRAESGLGLTESNVKLSDVGGLEACKAVLVEAAIVPIENPQFFTGKRQPWKAILLYGPPGTGKTYLANAIATETGSAFFSVSASDIVSKWMGESEKQVSILFQQARDAAPSIIFIDEIDSLCGSRGENNENEASRRIKTELLVRMQGVCNDETNVLVLAATNTPYALDQAMRRRFDKRIYAPLPDLKAREHIFKVHIGDTPHNLTETDFEHLARRTQGFSGSDIFYCVKDALYQPVRATLDAQFFRKTSKGMWVPCKRTRQGAIEITLQELNAQGLALKILLPPNTRADFDKMLARQKPTVSEADLEVHERFNKEFGNEG